MCDPAVAFQCLTCGRQSAATAEDHKAAHPGKRLAAGHELALDVASNEIFCAICNDYVYCPEVDRAVTVREKMISLN